MPWKNEIRNEKESQVEKDYIQEESQNYVNGLVEVEAQRYYCIDGVMASM